jgi:hypothetical protein
MNSLNYAFASQIALMCFLLLTQQQLMLCPNSMERLVFAVESQRARFEAGAEFLYVT